MYFIKKTSNRINFYYVPLFELILLLICFIWFGYSVYNLFHTSSAFSFAIWNLFFSLFFVIVLFLGNLLSKEFFKLIIDFRSQKFTHITLLRKITNGSLNNSTIQSHFHVVYNRGKHKKLTLNLQHQSRQ